MRIFREQFALKLKTAMERRGVKQKDLAEAAGVEPPSVSRWVTGKDLPSDENLKSICKKLKISEEYFTSSIDEENVTKNELLGIAVSLLSAMDELQLRRALSLLGTFINMPGLEASASPADIASRLIAGEKKLKG